MLLELSRVHSSPNENAEQRNVIEIHFDEATEHKQQENWIFDVQNEEIVQLVERVFRQRPQVRLLFSVSLIALEN